LKQTAFSTVIDDRLVDTPEFSAYLEKNETGISNKEIYENLVHRNDVAGMRKFMSRFEPTTTPRAEALPSGSNATVGVTSGSGKSKLEKAQTKFDDELRRLTAKLRKSTEGEERYAVGQKIKELQEKYDQLDRASGM